MFHPIVERWFEKRFQAPTPAQARAWRPIADGRDVLVAAPTGSGKTLAAFLACIDRLVRASCDGGLEDATFVLYISPLKALSNDIRKNLEEPLAELREAAREAGASGSMDGIRAEVRTGDTPAKERRKAAQKPPHVLVTTPESAFILLTSESGRKSLAKVRTVIVDELHAVTGDKRGAHLALSLERLDDLVMGSGGPRPQRIGLSATVRPIETAARLLVGTRRELPEIIDVGLLRELDLAIETPKDELGPVCTNEQWAEVYDRVAELAKASRGVLVFVNTRRLAERVALHLGERLGEDLVAAHHGSLSRARRFATEKRLKAGELRVVVATASLELGIDIGNIDLVCLIGSPRRVSTALQRIGRSGHAFGGSPKGHLFPLTRDQLIECAAIVRAVRKGVMDAIAYREAPLDVLSQQIVAACACEDRAEDGLFDLVRGAAPYAELSRHEFDQVVSMLSEGISTRRGRSGALVHRDGVNKRLRGRRGARLAALTSGGAIPDIASYDVRILADGVKVGSLDEDFAIDSGAGDVFLLGTTSWRIKRVESGTVWVEDARGAAPTVPFWFGEAPARSEELSREVGDLREAIAGRLGSGEDPAPWLMKECALDLRGATLARDYIAAAKAALGAVPTTTTIVAERFFDESGGMQLIIHAPFGGRINRAWGMALRKRFCRQFDFELQAAATDDGVLLSLSPHHSFPLETIFEMLHPDIIGELLEQASLQAPVFRTRWRWNLTRSLALLRFAKGRRVPAPLLRMRADDLLSAVFPEQQGCQDNHGLMAKIEVPDHPLVRETVRDCLVEPADAAGLREVLRAMKGGGIAMVARETPEPSVLSHEILNANPYAFLDDAPLEERRARAVAIRRGLPAEIVERIGGLDAEAIAGVVAEAQPDIRNADELHDMLLDLVALPEHEGFVVFGLGGHFDELVRTGRAARIPRGGSLSAAWVTTERRAMAEAIWPADASRSPDREAALVPLIRARLAITGPVTSAALARVLGVDEADVNIALGRVEADGGVLRGRFSPALPPGAVEWCDRRLLARIHRRTVDTLRRAIEPVSPSDLMRFLFAWQGLAEGASLHGRAGLLKAIDQLQGFELAAGAWESDVLPARVAKYDPAWLDALCLSGEVVWGRLAPRDATKAPPRSAPVTLARRRDLAWLLAPRDHGDYREGAPPPPPPEADLSPPAASILASLTAAGASFFDDIVRMTGLPLAEVEDGIWELVAAGKVTGDGFAGLRALLVPPSKRVMSRRVHGDRYGFAAPLAVTGRWSLLRVPPLPPPSAAGAPAPDNLSAIEPLARQYLARYGVVLREIFAREASPPAWRDLLRVYRRLEARGEIRGGRFVAGLVGEQFALPEALDALRAIHRAPRRGDIVRLSACDPLNLAGILTPGPRVPAMTTGVVIFRDGIPLSDEEARVIAPPAAARKATPSRARHEGRATA